MTDTVLAECEKVAPFRHATTVVSCTAVLTLTPPVATPREWASANTRQWASGNDREWT